MSKAEMEKEPEKEEVEKKEEKKDVVIFLTEEEASEPSKVGARAYTWPVHSFSCICELFFGGGKIA